MLVGRILNCDQNNYCDKKNSIATILSLTDERSIEKDLIPTSYNENELIFKGIIISVSAYDMLTPLAKLLRTKQSVLGIWSRKRKVKLEIAHTDTQLRPAYQVAKYWRSSRPARFQFAIQGQGIHRKYEVGSSEELNIWYSQFAKAKDLGTEIDWQDSDDCVSKSDSQAQELFNLSEQEYLFWRDYQRCIGVLERSAQMFAAA